MQFLKKLNTHVRTQPTDINSEIGNYYEVSQLPQDHLAEPPVDFLISFFKKIAGSKSATNIAKVLDHSLEELLRTIEDDAASNGFEKEIEALRLRNV
ncbi:hypothetical protein SAMN06295998_11483 [Primorskyibacter flagellatus]|uniref:Uncharacterized protein n=1 Tax=Primorskyibacter flagellatus TaxID=1387277 RepID=A0A1W2DIA0_9RHOB|nr:hypothetical protein SAMN06295998_11483 [Primorskyibacter flagellatus]